MLSLRAHTSVAAVLSYYKLADYYLGESAGEVKESAAQWGGLGAMKLGLNGEVDRAQFEALLHGKLPTGEQLGTYRDGQIQHRSSWDITLSAPKSVSVMAMIGGDRRLLEAHDEAVKATLSYLEARVAETRVREGYQVKNISTGNLIWASLREETSRADEPQLHTHNIIMNATSTADGKWRSVDGYRFFQQQMTLGQVYRSELALRCAEMGYEVASGKNGTFELAVVPDEVVREFSSRSAQIEAYLGEKGLSRATASPAQKDYATVGTRDRKTEVASSNLNADWQRRCLEHHFDPKSLVDDREVGQQATAVSIARQDGSAEIAVESAIAKLSERDAVFRSSELSRYAMEMSVGRARLDDIERAIQTMEHSGELIRRESGARDARYTTEKGQETERRMLASELAGRIASEPLLDTKAAHKLVLRQESSSENAWTTGQRLATAEVLSNADRIQAVQGFAGTAKTTTLLKTVSQEAERQGHKVVAMAPTAAAAETLGDSIGKQAITVSRHLSSIERGGANGRQIWLIDEASMLSARQMTSLLAGAEGQNARVILVGDHAQLSSVEAGSAFKQLQDAGMATAKLEEIVRQTNTDGREAVYAAIRGDALRALAAVERSGGNIREYAESAIRQEEIAKAFAALPPDERRNTLLIDPSREGRESLTQLVRDHLKNDGTIHGKAVLVNALDAKSLTAEDARHSFNYEVGDQVRFRSDYAAGVVRGSYYTVASVNVAQRTVNIVSDTGEKIAWQPEKWGSKAVEAYSVVPRELMPGDKIAWTKNDYSTNRKNGHAATVTAVSDDGKVTVARGAMSQTFDMNDPRNAHFRHGYVTTVHAAQGLTSDRVMINAESFRTNLLNSKSFYVSISRARSEVQIYTDDRQQLIRGVEERTGEKATALRSSDFSKDSGKTDRSALGEKESEVTSGLGVSTEGRGSGGAER